MSLNLIGAVRMKVGRLGKRAWISSKEDRLLGWKELLIPDRNETRRNTLLVQV